MTMAEDMNLQINIEGRNDTGSSFSSLDSQMNTLNQLAETVTRTFRSFMETITSAFTNAGRSAQELTRPLSELGTDAARASEVARAVGEIATSAENATRQVGNMNQAMNHSSAGHGSAGGHGSEGGLFSMQGQMDSMYAGMAMGAAALPLVGALKSSIDAYGQFSQAMENVNSMMGLSQTQLTGLSNKIIDLSKTVPGGPVALANALYGVVGAGVPAADQMDVLAEAAKAATAGQTDVGTSTEALISVMDSYGLKGKDVAKISDQMFAANAAGAMTFDSFAKSIGNVAGPAAQAGVSFEQVAAATAALTNQGLTAQRSTQGLRALLVGIMAPTKGATKEAKALGIEWDANALKSKGMTGMLDEAMKATHGNSEELKKLIPNIAAWTVAVDLGGKGADSYKQAMQTMSGSAGATDKALEAQEQGFQEKMNKMKAATQTAQIAFVNGFAPVLTDIITKIGNLASAFSNLSPQTQKIIGYVVLGSAAFLSIGSAMFMSISAIGALSMGFSRLMGVFAIERIAEGGAELTLFGRALNGLKGIITGFSFSAIGNGIKSIATSLAGGIGTVMNFTKTLTINLIQVFANLPHYIGSALIDAGAAIKRFGGIALEFATSLPGKFVSMGTKIFSAMRFAFSWQGIVAGVTAASTAIRTAITFMMGPWGILIAAVIAGVAFLITHWSQVTSWVDEHFGKGLPNTLNSLKNTFQQVWDSISSAVQAAWNVVAPTIIQGIQTVQKWWNSIWPELYQVLDATWKIMLAVLAPAIALIGTYIVAGIGFIKGAWTNGWREIGDVFKIAWDLIKGVVQVAWYAISGIISVGLDLLTGHWSKAWDDIKSMFSNIWDSIKGMFGSLIQDALDFGSNFVKSIANGITGAIGSVVKAAQNVWNAAKSALHGGGGGNTVTVDGVDLNTIQHAKGGIFDQPHFGLVAEAGPEAIIPLSNPSRGLALWQQAGEMLGVGGMALPSSSSGGNVYITVQANGNITRNEHELGQIVSRAILNQTKLQGRI
jgi:TP901 family phage tail tape measure protein